MVRLMWAPPDENLRPNASNAGAAAGKPIDEGVLPGPGLIIGSNHQIIVSFSPLRCDPGWLGLADQGTAILI